MQSGGVQYDATIKAFQEVAAETKEELANERMSSQRAFTDQMEEMSNPFAARLAKKEKPIKNRLSTVQKALFGAEKGERLLPLQAIKDAASRFQQRNPELQARMLLLLKDYIKPGDSVEDIMRKLEEFYKDVSLADEALDFLLEVTEGQLNLNIQEAKRLLHKEHEREILAGRNIGSEARAAADKGLGTPTSLRDLYRDITGNPRDVNTLFDEMAGKWGFADLKKVMQFLFHSLGSDLKSSGPSIPRALLHRLIAETRMLQAILGVYNFFKGRMALMQKLFAQNGLSMPETLTFEAMAKQFMMLVNDRYPSSDKALQTATRLGIEKWLMAKIIALSQLRDAIRQVALNQIYRSLQHRDDLYMSLIEALENLEDELQELEEREEQEEEQKEKKEAVEPEEEAEDQLEEVQ